MNITIIDGDISEQTADAIVNAWNCNLFPWFLLVPQGVARAIRRKSGWRPFWELFLKGPLRTGAAVCTHSGRMQCRILIHAVGITPFWTSNRKSIGDATENAACLALSNACKFLVFPVIGSGTGGFSEEEALKIMEARLAALGECDLDVRIVKYSGKRRSAAPVSANRP